MYKLMSTIFGLLICVAVVGQSQPKRVLFIGNSYTYVNDLPKMVAEVAQSAGDSVIYDSNTLGGYTMQLHSSNAVTNEKIGIGNWDFVVLQEQSQLPSFEISQVEAEVFPFVQLLDNAINASNPCAETMFYMTWGRKNGDASNCAVWPPVCTYAGMDSLLRLRYNMMAENFDGVLSPVGAVWHVIRDSFPSIELYQSDESHPSVAGTYAAACSFYTALFRKDPTAITFNSTLSADIAATIRGVAKTVVYDQLPLWHIGEYDPQAVFVAEVSGEGQVVFANNSVNATAFSWGFGDGNSSNETNPMHQYQLAGTYVVTLTATDCSNQDMTTQSVEIIVSETEKTGEANWSISPNPTNAFISIQDLPTQNASFSVFDIKGALVQSGNVEPKGQIDISGLPLGVYFIELRTGKQKIGKQKFVKCE